MDDRGDGVRVEGMLEDLRTLVEIESPSRDLDALRRSAAAVAAIIEARLGGRARLIESDAGPHVSWRGGGDPQVLVLGHHDTVFPRGTLARRPFEVTGGRVTGPGVFDMLGGLVQAIHGLATLDDLSGVEILVTADEEVGSGSSRSLLEERALACGSVLVVEGAAEGGAVKTGRKGCGTFEVSITGRAAHAGLEPEAGVNALVEAAHQVLALAALSRPELGTTVTPTLASAGTGENVVPAEAVVTVDVRVATAGERDRVEAALAVLAPHLEGATVTVQGAVDRPPMPPSASAELFALARSLRPGLLGATVGGGSDGNLTAALGVPTLDGLGAVGGGAHADHEWVQLDAMADRAELVASLVDAIRSPRREPTHLSPPRRLASSSTLGSCPPGDGPRPDIVSQPLPGGNMSDVVRVGDTVRRVAGPWTPTVHRLLTHVRGQGVLGVPEPHGIDEAGRERPEFLPGEVPTYPMPSWVWSDDLLAAATSWLRGFHDATTDLLQHDGPWQLPDHPPNEVICHNDLAPYNMVFDPDRRLVGVIDFDTCSPGSRVWDLAYLAYRMVPFHAPDTPQSPPTDGPTRRARLELLCRAYGATIRPADVLATITPRVAELLHLTADRARAALALRGHLACYETDLAYLAGRSNDG